MQMSGTVAQIKTLLQNLSAGKKIALFALVGLSATVFFFIITWAGRPDYQTLYTKLSAADAGAVVNWLKDQRIDYRLTDRGRAIQVPREKLYERINHRVDEMIRQGLIEEARKMYPLRELNALNTVGYKELFAYFNHQISKDEAIELLKRNTRRFAKRQMTWFLRDKEIQWFEFSEENRILELIQNS